MEGFRIEFIAEKMCSVCPMLWKLVPKLLTADDSLRKRKEGRWKRKELGKTPSKSSAVEFEEHSSADEDDPEPDGCTARLWNEALLLIVSYAA